MLTHWALIEADFTREYPHVHPFDRSTSWRRFQVLLRGLSPDSLWQRLCHARTKDQPQLLDAEAAERYFASIN